MNDKKTKSSLPFVRAYNFLLEKKDLIPAEKLVLIVLCRYWPSPFWGSNSTIAQSLGYEVRFIEKIIKRLKTKGYIKAGYAHKIRDGKNHTVRIIAPTFLEGKCRLTDFKIDAVPQDGRDAVRQDGLIPAYGAQAAVPEDDLLERNRRLNIKAASLPLPAEGQAKTLAENGQPEAKPIVRNYSQILKSTSQWSPKLTEQEFEQRRQNQIRRLKAV